jgi:hypothetical protein|tara:strand:- start:469 stop:609 length:141 start_codon:yes stop_codon:yes gene_type:complete
MLIDQLKLVDAIHAFFDSAAGADPTVLSTIVFAMDKIKTRRFKAIP